MNNRYREFVQIDLKGRDVSGTNRYFKKYPKGPARWRELTPQPCCAALELRATPADLTDTSFVITVLCDGSNIVVLTVTGDATTTIEDILHILQGKAAFLGKWSVDGTELVLQLSSAIAINCADAADLTLTVV